LQLIDLCRAVKSTVRMWKIDRQVVYTRANECVIPGSELYVVWW
jgi:hypothetical protein